MSRREQAMEREERVTPLELFFDLVFVFAVTQVTTMIAHDPTWRGLGQGLLVLAALWWAWVGYAWLTNTLDPEDLSMRFTVFGAMGAMLVAALAAPQAFGEDGVLFGAAYLVVRVLHVVLYEEGSRGEPELHSSVIRFAPTAVIGPGLILAAGFLDGAAQAGLWIAALALDYAGPEISGSMGGWRVAPAHFAERHGLIVIIALGESIAALGVGAQGLEVNSGLIAAALLGLTVAGALWWAYFDVVAIMAERKLTEATGEARARMARDSFSYIHLPMVAGIILFAAGVKKTLPHISEPLETVPAFALCGGVALYIAAHLAFRLRNVHTWSPRRAVTVVLCLALIPVALEVDALIALAALTAVTTGLIAYESIRYREARARLRSATVQRG
jgi:low temperature requirement protein LtrA